MLTQSLGMYNVKLYFNLSFVCIVPVGEGRRVFRTVWREHIVRKGAFWVRVNVAYGCISLPSLFWGSTGWWGLINRGKQQIERRYEIPTGCKKGLLEEEKKKKNILECLFTPSTSNLCKEFPQNSSNDKEFTFSNRKIIFYE